jgi:hypothetical protein
MLKWKDALRVPQLDGLGRKDAEDGQARKRRHEKIG